MPVDENRWPPGKFAGKSILEQLWDELDRITARLFAEEADSDDKGRAQGVAFCIAVLEDPYRPDILSVRKKAVRRFNQKGKL